MFASLEVLTGEASIFTVEAKQHSKVACLSRQVTLASHWSELLLMLSSHWSGGV